MLKKRVWRPIGLTVFFLALISVCLFFYSLLKVDLLLDEYLQLIAAVLVFFLYFTGVMLFYGMKRKRSVMRRVRRIIGIFLAIVQIAACLYGAVFLFRLDQTKREFSTKPEGQLRAIVGVYVKDDDPAQSITDMGTYRYAVLGELGNEKINTNYAIAQIRDQIGADVTAVSYSGITDAAAALRDGEVSAMAVNKSFLPLLNDTESFQGFADTLRLIEEIRVPEETQEDSTVSLHGAAQPEKKDNTLAPTPEPTPSPTPRPLFGEDETLVFFISGVDKFEAGLSNTHSDVNILMLVNTTTRQILLINTPRDCFVDNPALGGGDKLTHCGIQGVENSIAALENFYGIDIDNYVKVNFNGFETFIHAIDGITLNNPVAFSALGADDKIYHYPQGEITLSWEEALAYVRERESFGSGDLARGQNHLRVLTAMINKVRSSGPSLMMQYADIMKWMGDNFETDLTSEQISDLVKIASRNLDDWDIKSYGTSGYSGMRVTASGGSEPLYIIWPQQESVDFASRLMNMMINNEVITDDTLAEAPPIF